MSPLVIAVLLAVGVALAVFAYRRFTAQPEEKPRKHRNADQMYKM